MAQLPRGTAAQQAVLHQLRRLGRLIELAGAPGRELRRLRSRTPTRSGAPLADGGIARPCSVIDPPSNALRAYGKVVRNLGWDKLATKMIFSHTHQPLNGALDDACGDVRFWNTGSWIYEPRIESQDSWERYLDLGWPGTAVLIDTERGDPQLVELLRDENPRGHIANRSVPRPLGHSYEEAVGSRALAA